MLTAADKGQSVHAAVRDFTKAFDRVHHALLMRKRSEIMTTDEYLVGWFILSQTLYAARLSVYTVT